MTKKDPTQHIQTRIERRVVPVSTVALVSVSIVLLVELITVTGFFEHLQTKQVGRYAPWAYDAFLRWVGEHPDELPPVAKEIETTPQSDAQKDSTSGERSPLPLDFLGIPETPTPSAPATRPSNDTAIPVG